MTISVADFREGRLMVELLAASRREGLDFDQAWTKALLRIRRGRPADSERWVLARNAFKHHRATWQRAYDREPMTSLDVAGRALLLVLETMLDDSGFAEPQAIALPEAA